MFLFISEKFDGETFLNVLDEHLFFDLLLLTINALIQSLCVIYTHIHRKCQGNVSTATLQKICFIFVSFSLYQHAKNSHTLFKHDAESFHPLWQVQTFWEWYSKQSPTHTNFIRPPAHLIHNFKPNYPLQLSKKPLFLNNLKNILCTNTCTHIVWRKAIWKP